MLFFLFYFCGISMLVAAPNDSITVPTSPEKDSFDPPTSEQLLRLKSMEITQPKEIAPASHLKKLTPNDQLQYYPYKKSFSPRVGFVFDPDKIRNNREMVFLFGFIFMLPSESEKHWELGYDIHTGGIGYLQLNHRWVFANTEKFRPYLRAGLNSRMFATQGLASMVNHENLQVRLGFGFEDLVIDPLSSAVGMDFVAGQDQSFMAVFLGYSWAW